jgi:hypothetical protein
LEVAGQEIFALNGSSLESKFVDVVDMIVPVFNSNHAINIALFDKNVRSQPLQNLKHGFFAKFVVVFFLAQSSCSLPDESPRTP